MLRPSFMHHYSCMAIGVHFLAIGGRFASMHREAPSCSRLTSSESWTAYATGREAWEGVGGAHMEGCALVRVTTRCLLSDGQKLSATQQRAMTRSPPWLLCREATRTQASRGCKQGHVEVGRRTAVAAGACEGVVGRLRQRKEKQRRRFARYDDCHAIHRHAGVPAGPIGRRMSS